LAVSNGGHRMTIKITTADLRAIFPRAPIAFIQDADEWQRRLDAVGLTSSKSRLGYCFTNVEHECGGFTIPHLTENINYSPARAMQVWPSRFHSLAEVYAKTGSHANDPGFSHKLMNYVYGNRMGNRPGTDDGSRYIGRGGPQVTGRDGYGEIGKRTGLDLESNPELAALPEHQPAIIAAFWDWKGLNKTADRGDFKGCVRLWNGGQIGLADREHLFAGNDPVIARMKIAATLKPVVDALPPPSPDAAKAVVAAGSQASADRLRSLGKTAGPIAAGATANEAIKLLPPAQAPGGSPEAKGVSGAVRPAPGPSGSSGSPMGSLEAPGTQPGTNPAGQAPGGSPEAKGVSGAVRPATGAPGPSGSPTASLKAPAKTVTEVPAKPLPLAPSAFAFSAIGISLALGFIFVLLLLKKQSDVTKTVGELRL
jgi:predicted chitinase